jgi:hypothetical protein
MRCHFCEAEGSFEPLPALGVCFVCARRIGGLAAADADEIWLRPDDFENPGLQEGHVDLSSSEPRPPELDLAVSYREMGLHREAVRMAAQALAAAMPNDDRAAASALTLLLSAPLLGAHGMAAIPVRSNVVGPS